jgi:FKBP-type peptidyl-prolyl cis-trans isomerase
MRSIRLRLIAVTLAVAGLLSVGACGDGFSPQVIEETTFASSLNVDLGLMTKTASGLYVKDFEEGIGEPAVLWDLVFVSYTGYLSNGTELEVDEFSFTLGIGLVVAGFDEGVLGMKAEGRRRIILPPSLGYEDLDTGTIPPGSILIYDLVLDSIN